MKETRFVLFLSQFARKKQHEWKREINSTTGSEKETSHIETGDTQRCLSKREQRRRERRDPTYIRNKTESDPLYEAFKAQLGGGYAIKAYNQR